MNMIQYRIYRFYRWFHMHIFGLKPGCFIQDPMNTHMGENVQLSHGTQMYTKNHNLVDLNKLDKAKPIHIGKDSWIGANAIILPGVILGEHTVVGAGSVVTKSFIEGWCVIAGNPAEKIREITYD